tara:strand:+ start:31516 stop:31827 length:312 start_codon:yes stop_codon:yes gene_type:complete
MSEEQLNPEVQEQPVPFGFLIPLTQALEARIDYNFNSMIQLSLLVEYLYSELEDKEIGIEMGEKFQAFQDERIVEIKKQFEMQKAETESQVEVEDSQINLKDD